MPGPISLIALGRLGSGPERALVDTYLTRCRGWAEEIELASRGRESAEQEGKRLLAACPDRARVILMDERGEALDSVSFARRLQHWTQAGPVALLIGGADGHGPAVRAAAANALSLGPLTLPHMLARIILAEQLYRARTILDGHPYHREG